jgi:hypothetical protein
VRTLVVPTAADAAPATSTLWKWTKRVILSTMGFFAVLTALVLFNNGHAIWDRTFGEHSLRAAAKQDAAARIHQDVKFAGEASITVPFGETAILKFDDNPMGLTSLKLVANADGNLELTPRTKWGVENPVVLGPRQKDMLPPFFPEGFFLFSMARPDLQTYCIVSVNAKKLDNGIEANFFNAIRPELLPIVAAAGKDYDEGRINQKARGSRISQAIVQKGIVPANPEHRERFIAALEKVN